MPTTSVGIRSGVNCTREKRRPRQAANERASSVFPMPGTPSSSAWPPAMYAAIRAWAAAR